MELKGGNNGYKPLTSCTLCCGCADTGWSFTGNWAYGAIAGCTFFIAREHTQAEYRWIEMFGHGKRMNMPWWGGFDPRAWDVASLMDFAVPVVACLLVWLLVNRG